MKRWASVNLFALVALLVACGATGPTSVSTPASTNKTAPTAAAAPSASPAARKELEYVRLPRPFIVSTLDALKKNDVAGARMAFAGYDAAWNGVEVYVNVRSRELYSRLELDLQEKIEKELAASAPNLAALIPTTETMLRAYDESIALSEAGPPLNPLFDDVTAVRLVRADLRKVPPALQANDVGGAKSAFDRFERRWEEVEDLIRPRSREAYRDIEDQMKRVGAALRQEPPSAADVTPAVTALLDRYNFGLSLINAAARNVDAGKTAFSSDDAKAAATLGVVEAELRVSWPLWQAGTYPGAGAHARRASNDLYEGVAALLKAKGADANLKKALDAYAALADRPGDATKVRSAWQAAVDATGVAQQVLVGQFWTEPRLRASIATSLLTTLRDQYGQAKAQGGGAPLFAYQSGAGLVAGAESHFRQIEPKLKAESAAQADAIGRAFAALKGSFPDALAAEPPAADDAIRPAIDAALGGLATSFGRS
jgi:hypothetical protein